YEKVGGLRPLNDAGIIFRFGKLERLSSHIGREGADGVFYFILLSSVCFGSSTIFLVPAGADRRNDVSGPSTNTCPRRVWIPLRTAYTGTAVTKSDGPSFCTITPLTNVPLAFGETLTLCRPK